MIYTCNEIFAKVRSAAASVERISFTSWADKSTWRVEFQDSATDEERAAAQAVIDAIDLTATPLAMEHKSVLLPVFQARLTEAERTALESSSDARVSEWRRTLAYGCTVVEVDTEESEAMQAYLVTLGLFTAERVSEIFK